MKMRFLGVQYREKTWFGPDVAFLHRGSLFRGVAAQAGTGGKGDVPARLPGTVVSVLV